MDALQSKRAGHTESEYVDDRDLAERTPISRAQWQAWRRDREGPPYAKIGRRCVYHWPTVRAWIDARMVQQP